MTKTEYAELLKDPRWRIKRLEILIRDGRKCTKCGKTTTLQVHHKVYSTEYPWDSKNEELITLCKSCHEKTHNIKTKKSITYKPIIFTKESLQKILEIDSDKVYTRFINKLIRKETIYEMKGLLNGKVQIFYIEGNSKCKEEKVLIDRILKIFQQFKKEDNAYRTKSTT